MKETRTELVFILDRSGSMSGLESDTIGGFNSLLNQQKEGPGSCYVTTVLFDNRIETLHERIDVNELAPLTNKDYFVRGCTALLDAIGITVSRVKSHQEHVLPQYRADKVMVVIITDGYENASRKFRYEQVRAMIEKQKAAGWEFLFLGANIDAAQTASSFGIDADHSADYHADHEGTALNYEVLSQTVTQVRACPNAALGSGWKSRIDADYRGRKKR